jgi:hypothetical protein
MFETYKINTTLPINIFRTLPLSLLIKWCSKRHKTPKHVCYAVTATQWANSQEVIGRNAACQKLYKKTGKTFLEKS